MPREEGPVAETPPRPLTVLRDGADVAVHYPWFNGGAVVLLLLFGLPVVGCGAAWAGYALGDESLLAPASWLSLLAIPFLVADYWCVASIANTTRVACLSGRLVVEHGPLPWRRGFALEAGTVAALEIRREAHVGHNRTETYTYGLYARRGSGGSTAIIT